ncbi:MAG: hypothetical protein CVU65_10155 [Deltaproteobacteria bacterium HGW-Deltaproteobacteria-22]|nr:MAG: hypothetical protein CVU65_10155 [Deltaproteobacteria bacterium HGW-Deltaproteobacteria-22]
MKRSGLLTMLFGLLALACTPPNTKKAPVQNQVQYPYVVWKRALPGKTFIVEDSQRRLFGVELDEKNRPAVLHALEKGSGRKRWSREGELGLSDAELPWSVQVHVRGNTIAFWTADNRVLGLDRYSGVEKWEKPLQGLGLSVLGENFLTAWGDQIRLVEPETGKITSFSLGRRITAPLHVTPKGFIVAFTGDIAQLVDLENMKLTVKWEWKMNLDGGFSAGQASSSEDAIAFFQKTVAEDNFVKIVAYDLAALKEMYQIKIRGQEDNPRTFARFSGEPNLARLMIRPYHPGDSEWHTVDLQEGKLKHLNYVNGKLATPCFLGEKLSWCGTETGISAFTTHPWTPAWTQETIYPGSEGQHMAVGETFVIAGGSRVKGFSATGSTVFTYDLKSPSLKEPRVNRILGAKDGVLWFTVVDYSTDKVKRRAVGEVWAYTLASNTVTSRIPVGDAQNTLGTVRFLPESGLIVAADETSFVQIALANAAVSRKAHKVRIEGKESLGLKVFQNIAAITCAHGVQSFEIGKARDLGFLELVRAPKAALAGKPAAPTAAGFSYSFLAVSETHAFVRDKADDREVLALELKTGKTTWKAPMTDLLDPQVEVIPAGLLIVSPEKTRLLDPATGKATTELAGSTRMIRLADRVVLFHAEKSTPAPGARLLVVSYDADDKNQPKMLWDKTFAAGKEAPLAGFPVAWPLWVHSESEYVMFDSEGGRCLNILSSADGSPVRELCKGVWPWPPMAFERSFLHATGPFVAAVPIEQQGLFQFRLAGPWKQILKLGKSGDGAMIWRQFSEVQKATLYLLMQSNALSAVQVGDPESNE